jgi:hypothetical protein
MIRYAVAVGFAVLFISGDAVAVERRRTTSPKPFPPCTTVTGTAAVTFTRDGGRTLAPTSERLEGIGYTYGLAALDKGNGKSFLAWHKTALLLSEDAGCSWSEVARFDDLETFPPQITAAKGGRAYAWSENGRFLVRYDARGVVRLKQPVEFLGVGTDPKDGEHVRAGGNDGSIWDSRDGGETWEYVGSLRGPLSFYRFTFDREDIDHVVAGTLAGGAFYSFDGGLTWQASSGFGQGRSGVNVFNLVISPANGNVVWAMAINLDETEQAPSFGRHIYLSTDGGVNYVSVIDRDPAVTIINGPVMAADPFNAHVLYFIFGTRTMGYGTDVFRYDASDRSLTINHNGYDDINSIAFSPKQPGVVYFGLETEEGIR